MCWEWGTPGPYKQGLSMKHPSQERACGGHSSRKQCKGGSNQGGCQTCVQKGRRPSQDLHTPQGWWLSPLTRRSSERALILLSRSPPLLSALAITESSPISNLEQDSPQGQGSSVTLTLQTQPSGASLWLSLYSCPR